MYICVYKGFSNSVLTTLKMILFSEQGNCLNETSLPISCNPDVGSAVTPLRFIIDKCSNVPYCCVSVPHFPPMFS